MCATCGCAGLVHDHDHGHDHDHDPGGHGHAHAARPAGARLRPGSARGPGEAARASRRVAMEVDLLARNDAQAARNRAWLAERGVVALNFTSSPGSGKTTLLERTLTDLGRTQAFVVVEGDQATELDADRIRATGTRAVQVNTGAGCHLDAAMVDGALRALDPPRGALALIENVGNLVCPAMFDLGERARVVVASVAEGDDKPAKYPHMFRGADVVVLNKVDLLPYVRFDVARFEAGLRAVGGARAALLAVSATRGDGLDAWYAWLRGAGARGTS